MDPDILRWLLVAILGVLLVSLYVAAFSRRERDDTRFRFFAAASLLLLAVLVLALGPGVAVGVWFAALWIFAIVASQSTPAPGQV